MFNNKRKQELISLILQFQKEMITRVKTVREAGGVDYPYLLERGFSRDYIGSVVGTDEGYQVEYIDNIGFYGQSGKIMIWENDERYCNESTLLYSGIIHQKKPFVIGRVQIDGDFVGFPRLDGKKNPAFYSRTFTDSNEDLTQLQLLLKKTDSLHPIKNPYARNDR